MTELERQLTALGGSIEFPPAPELATRVRARVAPRPRPRRSRALVIALALAIVALAAALAVPSARSTLLRWFHIRGATVIRVENLPPAQERGLTGRLGRPTTVAGARRTLGFRIALPPRVVPRHVYVLDDAVASVVLPGPLVLSEFRNADVFVLKQFAAGATQVAPARVGTAQGLWLTGAAHDLGYKAKNGDLRERLVRTRGNVLLWSDGGVTFRLAGKISRAAAVRLAETVNPS